MNKKLTFLTATLLLLIYFTPPVKVMGQSKSTETTTYTFSSKSWAASPANWTSGKDGNGFTSGQGIQVTTGASGANATSPSSFTSVSKIEVKYCTNASNGVGTIKVQVGSGTEQSFSVTKPSSGGTTLKTTTFNYATPETGNVKITVNCSTNSVYIYSIAITTSTTPAYTITAQSNNTTYGTVSLSGSVITGSPNSGYRYASPAYTVSSGTATVSQSGNDFTVTPSSDCTVTINFEAIPTHTATFSVNGATTSTSYAEGATITFPSDPANTNGKTFVGWITTTITDTTDDEPSFVNTATETMGDSDVTYYAVFATATASGDPVETKTQTLQYDSWTYSGSTTDKTSYRLFHTNSYIESAAFDLSKLNKVIVYGGTFGGSSYNSLTIGDGTNTWKSVTVSGSEATGTNTYTDGTALTGTNKLRVTSNSGTATSSGVRISKVEIFTMETPISYSNYCTSFEVYTITAVSNNNEYGTVSLSGEVITGAPKSGYRYASPAYTVTVGTATVTQSGNDFTVTPASNCTVQINFELIPTYTLSSAVSPTDAGNVVLGASTGLLEGATSSATATANAGYEFTGWSISGTGATLSSTTDNPTTVTIGTANATITANFATASTHAITYSVNGITNMVNVVDGLSVDLSAPASALIPVGYVFKGWRTATLASTNTDPDDYVTSATSTADITYYAVMAVESLSNSTWTLDYANESDLSSSTDWGTYGTAYDYTASDGGTWTVKAYKSSGMQINTKKDCSIKVPSCSGNIQSIAITCSAAKAVGFSANDYSGSGTITYLAEGTDATSQTLDLSSQSVTDGYIVPKSGSTSITKIVVTYKIPTYSSFCTSVSTVTLTEDVTIAGDLNVSYVLTIPSGKTLTVGGTLTNATASNLVIEDGGQLVTSSAVSATVKKSIAAWTTDPVGGWYFIASPVNAALNPTAAGLITDNDNTNPTYDFYYLNGSENKWKNYRNATFSMSNGAGYLYANQSEQTLSFSGEIKPYSTSVNTVTLANTGWNLIGNPFTCEVSVSTAFSELNNGTAVTNKDAGSRIMPCAGIAVYGTSGQTVTFTKAEAVSSVAPGQGGLNIAVVEQTANTRGVSAATDNAIVSFNEGSTLPKFNLLEGSAKLYIPQGNEEYAIAYSEGQGEMPVNFKAANNGTYTLTVNAEGVEMAYLHLIDNMTGTEVDLLAEPSYTFEARTTDYESRFRLVFASSASEDANGDNAPFAFVSNGEIVVNGTGTLQVVDVLGRILRTQETSTANSQLSTANYKPGVYVLRLIDGENVRTQKIVVR